MANDLSRGQPISSGSGLRTNAHSYRASSDITSRDDIGDLISRPGHQPRLWDAVGYPEENELVWETYWTRYTRTGAGHGIVEKFVNDTWQTLPEVNDDHDGDGETDFESDIEDLFKQQGLRKGPGHWLRVADKMATMGRYSVLVLGVDDGQDPSQPIPGFDDEERPLDGLDDFMFVGAYSEDDVLDFEIEDDFRNERFRLPTEYEIEVDDEGTTETFHHSRVIHIAQNVFDDPLRGIPFLKPVTHELLNIDKILAASAEGYWRGAYQGFVIKPPTNSDGVPLKFTDQSGPQDSSELAKQINEYTENFRRTITSTGDIEQLDASIASPNDHLESQFRSISSALDAPQSILMGNETGERATQEDKAMWNETIHNRRVDYGENTIYRQFVDRLVDIGILSEPRGESYDVEWDARDQPSEAEVADIKTTLAQAIDRMSAGRPTDLFTRAELRKILDYEPEIGAEVDESVEQPDAPTNPEDALPPEEVPDEAPDEVPDEEPEDDEPPPDERTNTFVDEPRLDRSETDGAAKWHSEDEPAA